MHTLQLLTIDAVLSIFLADVQLCSYLCRISGAVSFISLRGIVKVSHFEIHTIMMMMTMMMVIIMRKEAASLNEISCWKNSHVMSRNPTPCIRIRKL